MKSWTKNKSLEVIDNALVQQDFIIKMNCSKKSKNARKSYKFLTKFCDEKIKKFLVEEPKKNFA
jgi:hypothetical protein